VSLTEQQGFQASLPVRAGSLGIRRVSSLAPSSFLASTAGTRDLQDRLLRWTDRTAADMYERCLTSQLLTVPNLPPSGSATDKQLVRDKPVFETEYNLLLELYSEPNPSARLLAAASPDSGDCLHALPIATCGLYLDDDSVRIAVSLRLGCAFCQVHTYQSMSIINIARHARN
jgi:hypothetical protein